MNTSWKYDNTFIKYRLDEADRSRFILPNNHLSSREKEEIIEFFKVHNEAGKTIPWQSKKILDWGYEDFLPYMQVKTKNLIKSDSRKLRKSRGLSELTEGGDYVVVEDNDKYTAYLPLNHKSSRIIASNMVEPKLWCESSQMDWTDKEILPKGEPMKGDLYPGAKWCISMENPKHWNRTPAGASYLMVCYKDPNRPDEHKKECIVYYKGMLDEMDSVDASDTPLEFDDDTKSFFEGLGERLYKIIAEMNEKNAEKFKQEHLNPKTGRYDKPANLEFNIEHFLDENGEITIPLGKWEGNFMVQPHFTSLKNVPTEVTGEYSIYHNPYIKSLKGSPEKVGKFLLISNKTITSLEGSPKEIGYFECMNCSALTSLKGLGKVTDTVSLHECENLESLEGLPRQINGNVTIVHLHKLKSLKSELREVKGDFGCIYCDSLTSLEGAPERVGGDFKVDGLSGLTNLKGSPKYIGGDYRCFFCKSLKSLEGSTEEIGKSFNCFDIPVTSLKGSPRRVGGDFGLRSCPELENLDGAPEYVGGDFMVRCKMEDRDKMPDTEIRGRYINTSRW